MILKMGEHFNLRQVEKSSKFNGLEIFCRNNDTNVFEVTIEDDKIIIKAKGKEDVTGNA
jgi:hypothetical protein